MADMYLGLASFTWMTVLAKAQHSPVFLKNITLCDGAITEKMSQQPWLIGEHSPGGFCNQLFGIYSTIPLARLIGANLILGPIFSRRSFTTTYEKFKENMVALPYSSFFDYGHLRKFWRERGLQVVQKVDVKECMNMSAVLAIKRPRFFSHNDQELHNMLSASNFSLPLPRGVGVSVTENHGLTALYDHLQDGNTLLLKEEGQNATSNRHLQQLADTHSSLQPNGKMR